MKRVCSTVLLAALLCGCANYKIWPEPSARAVCSLSASAWLVSPPELRWRRGLSFGWFTLKPRDVEHLRSTLPQFAQHYLRHARGYAVESGALQPGPARALQEWAWSASPGDPLPPELLQHVADLTEASDTPGTLLLIQGSFHPRSDLWLWVAAATLFVLPVLTVGDDHEMRVDAYGLPDGAHLWRTVQGQDGFGYRYDPVTVTWDLLHTLPRAGAPCSSAPEP